jgi:DNA-binding response OmpR family regulator
MNLARGNGVIDLIVLDVMLPGGTSGFEVCRRVRSDPTLYTTPILLMSAMSGDEEIMHGLAQGADDYVPKPFDVTNLLQRIDALLRHNRSTGHVDEMTSLPNAWATKREVQRRLLSPEPFVLACAEVMNLREFGRMHRGDARDKTIRHLGRALKLCGERLGIADFMVGHMGGGYFVCILGSIDAERYCSLVLETWKSHLSALYESFDLGKAYQQAIMGISGPQKTPILELLVCATHRAANDATSSQELFEVLTQIRNNAMTAKVPGAHINRRA